MTAILADHQYTLNDFRNISSKLSRNRIDIDDNTINVINGLATLVGAPTYKKTPVFTKPIMRKERPRRGKVTITASDWEEMRNFKVTELNKNENGVEKQIDDVRGLLNKITSKNFKEMKEKITEMLNKIIESEASQEDLTKIGESIFETGSMNKFWSKLYAELYKELMKTFPVMNNICMENFAVFSELFKNIRYVSEENYDEFCLVNKENSKRRAVSSFFVHLMKEGVIETEKISEIILELSEKFLEYINKDGMKNQADEICENLFILIKDGIETIENDGDEEENYNKIIGFVSETSNLKTRNFKSLTSKTLFKFMDLLEYC
jgi:hypothetical protein